LAVTGFSNFTVPAYAAAIYRWITSDKIGRFWTKDNKKPLKIRGFMVRVLSHNKRNLLIFLDCS